MVSHAQRQRARRVALIALGVSPIIASAFGGACSREQNLVDEPDSGSSVTGSPVCDAGIPEVPDSGITSEELVPCADRPLGACQGSNDFPCEFELWFRDVVLTCQSSVQCQATGCVEALMGADGCVNSVNMTEPNDEFVACLVENFGAYRCPCGETSARRFVAGSNAGCRVPCGTGENTCPAGEACVEGFCEPIGAGGSG